MQRTVNYRISVNQRA